MRRLVVGLAISLTAGLAPTRAFADKQQDQQIAGHIFEKLTKQKEQGHLRGFDVRMRVINGSVWLTGYTASDAQRKLVLEIASHTKDLGTKRVINDVKVRNAGSSQPTVAAKPAALPVTADPKQIANQDEPKPATKPSTRPSLFAALGVSLSNPLRQGSADESNGTQRQAAYALAIEEKKKTQHSSRRVVGRRGSTFKRQAMYRHPQSDNVRHSLKLILIS